MTLTDFASGRILAAALFAYFQPGASLSGRMTTFAPAKYCVIVSGQCPDPACDVVATDPSEMIASAAFSPSVK